MSIARTARWRILFVVAGATMAIGGPLHPESDAEDSLRDELATMTSGDTWVLSHSLIAVGTLFLALGLWSALRSDAWPASTRRALRLAAITMSLYVVETVFHLASVVDSNALADGDAAPVAFAHVGLALVLYPVSGLSFAWLNVRLVGAVRWPFRFLCGVGVVAGLLHASSVPLSIVFPDAELTPVFASAGMLFAAWSLAFGAAGLGAASGRDVEDAPSVTSHDGFDDESDDARTYRSAERGLWSELGARVTERRVHLPRLGVDVRVQELGEGEPVLYVHSGPSAGTNWALLAARLDGFRSIIVDRPGSGLSEPYPTGADDLGEFADRFVVDLLDGLELDRAHVVASSFGGFLALRAAAVAPQRFDRMVQMGCPAGAPGMLVPRFMRAAAVPALRRLMVALPPNERAGRSMLRQIGHGVALDAGEFTPAFMEWYLSLQRNTATMRNDLALISQSWSPPGGSCTRLCACRPICSAMSRCRRRSTGVTTTPSAARTSPTQRWRPCRTQRSRWWRTADICRGSTIRVARRSSSGLACGHRCIGWPSGRPDSRPPDADAGISPRHRRTDHPHQPTSTEEHHMHHQRHIRRLLGAAALAALTLTASLPASASATERRGSTVDVQLDGLSSPKGLDSFLGQPIVAQGASGPPGPVLAHVRIPGRRPVTQDLSRPIGLVDVAVAPDGSLWGLGSDLRLHRKRAFDKAFAPVADIPAYQRTDPDPFNAGDDPTESNPYGLAVMANGDALVADAANNDLLRITRGGRITTLARFDTEVVATDHLGAPGLPPALPAESVPTSIAVVGRSIYVGELKGFPFRPGSSRVWKIDSRANGAVCSVDPARSAGCSSALSGFTAIQDLDVDARTGSTYVYQLAAGGVLAFEGGFESGQFPPAVLQKVSPRGSRTELAAGQLSQPGGVDVGLFGAVHVTDGIFGNGRLLRVRS